MLILVAGLPEAFAQSFTLTSSPTVGMTPFGCVAAEVNGDGKVDLISVNGRTNTLTVLTNDGAGNFGIASSPTVGQQPYSVAVADFNGDGKVDLVSADSHDGTLTTLTNDGNGGFGYNATYTVGKFPLWVITADMNGDGWPDLICANQGENSLSILTNNGSGGFGFYAKPTTGSSPLAVVAADVNGDGKIDLISADSADSKLSIFTNNGAGGLALASRPAVDLFAYSVTAADVNGDGKVDLISANQGQYHGSYPDGTLTILTNNGGGIFTSNANYTVGYFSIRVTAADLNGDGKPDLIAVCNRTGGFLRILTNDGTGNFSLPLTLTAGHEPSFVTAADVNGDGRLDLICANDTDNTLSVLMNTSTFPPPTSTPSLAMKMSKGRMRVSWPIGCAEVGRCNRAVIVRRHAGRPAATMVMPLKMTEQIKVSPRRPWTAFFPPAASLTEQHRTNHTCTALPGCGWMIFILG